MNKKRTAIYFTLILLLSILGCSEEGIFEKEPTLSDYTKPNKYEFSALDFPSANGSSWTYIEAESGIEYTVKIDGVRNISGQTCRRVKRQLVGEPTNFYSANSLYLKADGEYAFRPSPVSATYFQKTLDYYTELAFEVCIQGPDEPCIDIEDNSVQHNTFKQEHFPPRKLWKFPIQLGSEWIVFRKPTPETITVVRNVTKIVSVKVPEDSYPDAYLVEERVYFSSPSEQADIEPDALYWVVPEVGVVKYQYYDYVTPSSDGSPRIRTFMLKEWQGT